MSSQKPEKQEQSRSVAERNSAFLEGKQVRGYVPARSGRLRKRKIVPTCHSMETPKVLRQLEALKHGTRF